MNYFLWSIFLIHFPFVLSNEVDPLGYILYCPCMGRFGNQADQFLGVLSFARALNRTLVLPPWVEYRYGEPRSIQVPFDTYFDVEFLGKFHKTMTMEKFMTDIAPTEWPPDKRISFCYMSHGDSNSCKAKEGNPFGPFWDTFNVDFVGSEFYGPLHYDTHHHDMSKKWNERYSPALWPVLSFTGAPASFPVQQDNLILHKYLKWSKYIMDQVEDFISNTLPKGAFIGIHLRNGIDWVRACEHVPQSPNLFASPQCLGYRNEKGTATVEMCLPSKEIIIRQLKRAIKNYNNAVNHKNNHIKAVFVASDNNHMLDDLSIALKRMNVKVFKYKTNDPHVDLAILGQSNYFIGNCVSTYSAFVKRERDVNGYPSGFWGFPVEKNMGNHDEFVRAWTQFVCIEENNRKMATEAQRLIGISLTKIAQSRANRGGVSLHKNLLVATVLQKARYVFMEEAYNMVHYQVQSPAPPINHRPSNEDNLVGLTAEEAGIEPLRISEDLQETSTSESSLPDFLQPCVRCNGSHHNHDKENQPPPYHGTELTYLDLDKTSNVLRERGNSSCLKRRRAVAEWETEEAVQSILPKRSKSDDEDDSVFLDDAAILSDVVSKEIEAEKSTETSASTTSSAMEIDRITSLVSIFSFGMSEAAGKLNRSVSTPDLCSAQAKDDDALQQRPFIAMTV
ncbi:hypothetical protein FQR65_LT12657 [Abscondita terminalis]|nr:hypothetical protein FQR65_LT12657 [Abscondita terminalis]